MLENLFVIELSCIFLIMGLFIVLKYLRNKYYIFNVIGDSMSPTILNKEKLLIERTKDLKLGDIVIAKINYKKYKDTPILVVKRIGVVYDNGIEKEFFLVGDNKENSIDSRNIDFGLVKINQLEGKMIKKIMPTNKLFRRI